MKSKRKNKSSQKSISKGLIKKMKTKLSSKIRQYNKKGSKRTRRVSRKVTKTKMDRGGIKLLAKIKRFLRADVSSAGHIPVSEIGRMTIRDSRDVKLIEDVVKKLADINEYQEEQDKLPYCSVCNDQPNGCHACNQHN